ncbi:hypothetical protein K439DRAFT_1620008 [Ramaria rubella]|nr:hypothetical protein K439DRAFT_1620008 [Ramaria rubella]
MPNGVPLTPRALWSFKVHSLPPNLRCSPTPPPTTPCHPYCQSEQSCNFQGYFFMFLPIACSYTVPEHFVALQVCFFEPYCQALIPSKLLVVAKIFTNEKCAREREQRQMSSTTNWRECAAAATATRMLHQPPPPPHPFPHLALQQPQMHSGDPFVQLPTAGPSYIPNPQPPNPSPRDQVADIHAQLAVIQRQQPPPARRGQQSTVQTVSGVRNVPLGAEGLAQMHAWADVLRQQLPQSAVQPRLGVNNVPLGTSEVARIRAQADALRQCCPLCIWY